MADLSPPKRVARADILAMIDASALAIADHGAWVEHDEVFIPDYCNEVRLRTLYAIRLAVASGMAMLPSEEL